MAVSYSFKFKTKITGSASDNLSTKHVEIVVSLKYLSNVWKNIKLSLKYCKVNLSLNWSKDCVTTDVATRTEAPDLEGNPLIL